MPAAAVLVALGAFAMLWALIGLQYGYGYTLGAFLQQLARAIGAIRLPSFLSGARLLGFAADAITAIDNAVRRAIGLGIEAWVPSSTSACISWRSPSTSSATKSPVSPTTPRKR